jgi:hypothetical protein
MINLSKIKGKLAVIIVLMIYSLFFYQREEARSAKDQLRKVESGISR